MLEVDNVDWHLTENSKSHHTDRFEIVHQECTPVLRRAQPFKLTIKFKNRSFDENKDRVRLTFLHGSKKISPRILSVVDDTSLFSTNKINDSRVNWSIQIVSSNNSCISVLVRSPPTAAWGLWNLSIKSSLITSPTSKIWRGPQKFYLLYNPWNKDDEVYMPETIYLDEYILNDIGKIYTTSYKKPIGMKWVFGQFASPVLKVLIKIIDDADLTDEQLESPSELCLAFAKNLGDIVNGDWSGDYSQGTAPWLWTGSIPIMEKYLETNASVKYGQCYTYCGIFTTALRAVGIPARSLSCFVSATSAYNLSVNDVYNKEGKNISSVFIWNFHCWNDAWMARYDLVSGYGGWQAADCSNFDGPASVEAIKKGEIFYPHSTRGFMGQINADRIRWTLDENGQHILISVDTRYVGRALLTKRPFIYDPHGDSDFQDVILNYKEPEGSQEERMAMYNAIKHCKLLDDKDEVNYMGNIPYHIDIAKQSSNFNFEIRQIDYLNYPEPINAKLLLKNTGEIPLAVETCLSVNSSYYNGPTAAFIKKQIYSVQVASGSSVTVSMEVTAAEYAEKIVEFSNFRINCLATIKETKFSWANNHCFVIHMPEIIILARDDLKVNEDGAILFRIKNYLNSKLTNCRISYQASGISTCTNIKTRDILSYEEVEITELVKPTISGELTVKAIFSSKEVKFLCGSSILNVDPE